MILPQHQQQHQEETTATMPANTTTKGVRFNDECNQVLEVESIVFCYEGIVEQLWYQPWEHKEQKRAMKRDAREWRKSGLGILLRDTFCNPNPQQTQNCLNAFVQLADADYVRGIERYLSQQHDEQRVERRRSHEQDVLEQARYLQAHPHLTEDEKRTKLAEFSALQSKCAEVFARRIGKADEHVVQKGEDPKAASKLVSKLFRNEFRRSRSVEVHPNSSSNVMATHESRHNRHSRVGMMTPVAATTPRRISVPPLASSSAATTSSGALI